MGLSADVQEALTPDRLGLRPRWPAGAGDRARPGSTPTSRTCARRWSWRGELLGFPRHLSQHVGGFVIAREPLRELVPIENAAMPDRTVVEWDKDDLDALRMLKIDVLALGMLTCIRKGVRAAARASRRRSRRPRRRPGRGPGGLRDARACRHDRRVPGREPGADVDAAAAQAADLLRSGHRGRDRPPGTDPGRHGASLSAPPRRHRAGGLPSPAPEHGPPDELERVLGKTMGVPLFQEQAMRIAIVAARFTPERGERAPPRHGHLPPCRHDRQLRAKLVERHGRARLRPRLRRALLPADRGLRRVRLPGKPCRQLRAPGLRLGLAQVPLPGRVLRRHPQRPADGLLRPGPARARRASTMASRCARSTSTTATGTARWSRASGAGR